MPAARGARLPVALLALALLATALRLAALPRATPVGIEEARYLVAAHHLRNGMGYTDWRGPEIDIHPLHPVLTALPGGTIDDLELRGRIVTLAASCLLLLPLAGLAHRLSGGPGAAVTLLLAGTHPWLVWNAVSAQPESLYVLLVASAILALWPGGAAPAAPWRLAVAGLLFGLAYLARPEGFLVGAATLGVWVAAHRREGRARFLPAFLFLGAMLLAASPYLLFLRRATGEWTLTGKVGELFFVGQALQDAGGTPPEIGAYLDLLDRWKSVSSFVLANPVAVLMRATANAARIFGWTVPRALGPAGLLGIILCAALWLRRRDLRPLLMMMTCPALTLVLMLLTFRNVRVIASVLPFLFVLAAAGLAASFERPALQQPRWHRAAIGLVVVSAACLWTGPAIRAWTGPSAPDPPLVLQAARIALRESGGPRQIASNNPAISFHVGDATLFGPPGHYEPLPWSTSCRELAVVLRQRGARVAVIDGGAGTPAPETSGACSLRVAARLVDPARDQAITILALDAATVPPR